MQEDRNEDQSRGKDGAPVAGESSPLRVALDLRLIHHSGIGSYLRGLLAGFAELRAPVLWTLIGPQCEVPSSLHIERWIDFDAPPYSLKEFRQYPALGDVDLFHFPHYNLPLTDVRHRLVTVYDLFHLRYGSIPKRIYQRFFLSRLAWTKTPVITIARKTREELLAQTGIAAGRVTTIPLGPGRPIPHESEPIGPGGLRLQGEEALSPPWFLAVGIDKPHKNMEFLLATMALWYRRRPDAPPLVWVGASPEHLPRRAASVPAHARTKILLRPYQPDGVLEQLYAGAEALIFPSVDEGFGFPPLEAMTRGVPVICSRRRPMTDLLGDAPLWFDPKDSATLWRALDRLTDEAGLRSEAIERGRLQAAKLSWLHTARETFALYTRLTGKGVDS